MAHEQGSFVVVLAVTSVVVIVTRVAVTQPAVPLAEQDLRLDTEPVAPPMPEPESFADSPDGTPAGVSEPGLF